MKNYINVNLRAIKLMYKNYPGLVLSSLVKSFWASVSPFIVIVLSSKIVEELSGTRNKEYLFKLIILTLLLSAISSIISSIIKKWNNIQKSDLFYKMDYIYIKKMQELDYESVDNTNTRSLLSTIRQNSLNAGWGLYRVIEDFEQLFTCIFTFLTGISLTISLFISKVPSINSKYLFLNNPIFIVLIIVILLLINFISPLFTNKSNSYWAKYANTHSLANRLFGFYCNRAYNQNNALDIRIYDQNKICEKFNTNKEGAFMSNGLFAHLAKGPIGIYNGLASAIYTVFSGFVYFFVCLKSWAGAFGVGLVTQYISSLIKVSSGMSNFVSTLGDIKANASFLDLVFEFLDLENKMYKGTLTVEKRDDNKYEIEFRNVSFKYPNTNEYVLKNINFKINIGSKIAIVGMNGSGKTTFIKLLCRLYDPTEGVILLNGIDIRKYNYKDYLSIFSIVFQDFSLFSFKLGENVASSHDYDKKKVIESLNKSGYDISKLKEGLDTYLYKDLSKVGIDLSGGEAQKIAIARSIYKGSPFIILDEPTAALDPIAEAEIYDKFKEIVTDKTTIYISHRLSSCKFCDQILVFDNGKIIQIGNHKSLLKDVNNKYFELWNAQAKYYTNQIN